MKIKIRKSLPIRKHMIILFAIIAWGLSFFHLVGDESNLLGISIDDIGLVAALMWGVVTWYKLRKCPSPKYEYGFWCVGVIILTVLSSLQAENLFGQPFMLGFRAQRTFLAWAILYFPLQKAIHNGWYSKQDLRTLIRVIGGCELFLFIGQYILRNQFLFLQVNTNDRYGEIRFYFQPVWLILLLVTEIDEYVNTNKTEKKLYSGAIIVLVLFEVMVVQKFRLTTIGAVACIVMGLFIARSSVQRKFVYVLIGGLFLILLSNTTMMQDIFDTLLSGSESGNLSIREAGRALYMKTLREHPLLGGGYPNQLFLPAYIASGANKSILLVDNGVFGFAYIYGGLGVMWFVSLWVKMLRNGYKLFNFDGSVKYFLFPMFFLITGINEAHWYWMNGFMVLVYFLAEQSQAVSQIRFANSESLKE